MGNFDNNDIRDLITEIERAEVVATDALLDSDSREAVLRTFLTRRAGDIVELLSELKQWRETSAQGGGNLFDKQSRVLVEGFSDESAAAALSDGLNKAAHYFAESMDVSITLKQLTELAGGGHRAVLELHITPMNLKDHAHVKGLDIELKKFHDKDFHDQVKREEGHVHHLVFDHFVHHVGASEAALIPDHLMINVRDADLMNYMIEKEFFKAGHEHEEEESPPHPSHIMVRKVGHGHEPEPH
ncbi:MAG TPA: hypothetical protein PKI93_07385 [Alphaproteobacteria bacterium]|nr:hypothetical protein [Alphaproteobacteria bacterium]